MSIYTSVNDPPRTLGFKAPGADVVETFTIDWDNEGSELSGAAITASSWSMSPFGLIIDLQSRTTTTTTLRVAGGTLGVVYTVVNTVTAGSQIYQRSFQLMCRHRPVITVTPIAPGNKRQPIKVPWAKIIGSSGTINSTSNIVDPSGELRVAGYIIDGTDVYVWVTKAVVDKVYTVYNYVTTNVGKLSPQPIQILCKAM